MAIKLLFLSIIVLITNSSYSNTYCFERGTSLSAVKSHLSIVLTANDRVISRGNSQCLDIEVSDSRSDLVLKWLKKKYRVVMPSASFNNLARNVVTRNCRLQIEKITRGKSNETQASIGKRNNITNTTSSSQGVSRSSMLLGEGYSGTLSINSSLTFITCRNAAPGSYSIQVSLNEQNSSLSTGLVVQKGQKINIGQVVENLNSKSKTLNLSSGVQVNSRKGEILYDYFLIAQ